MSNLSSTAGTVHAIMAGYTNRSACGTMQKTASKFRTDKPVDCPNCLTLDAQARRAARANAIVEGTDAGNLAPANETHEFQWLSIAALNDEQAIHHDRMQRDDSAYLIYCAAYARQLYRNELHRRALIELVAARNSTTDMAFESWATRVLIDAGMHAEMMA